MGCKYAQNECELLKVFFVMVKPSEKFCGKCGRDYPGIIRKFGYSLPECPLKHDYLDWAEQNIMDDNVSIDKFKKQITEKTELEQAKKELPSKVRLAINFTSHMRDVWKHYKKTGRVYVSDEHAAARLAICKNCPTGRQIYDGGQLKCRVCGCGLERMPGTKAAGKSAFEALKCSDDHWKEIDESYGM